MVFGNVYLKKGIVRGNTSLQLMMWWKNNVYSFEIVLDSQDAGLFLKAADRWAKRNNETIGNTINRRVKEGKVDRGLNERERERKKERERDFDCVR